MSQRVRCPVQKPLSVLLVEDSEDDAMLLLREIRKGWHDLHYERVDLPPEPGRTHTVESHAVRFDPDDEPVLAGRAANAEEIGVGERLAAREGQVEHLEAAKLGEKVKPLWR